MAPPAAEGSSTRHPGGNSRPALPKEPPVLTAGDWGEAPWGITQEKNSEYLCSLLENEFKIY